MAKVSAGRRDRSRLQETRKLSDEPAAAASHDDGPARLYLTPSEVEQLVKAAASVGRHRFRDSMLIAVAYHHGLRVGELVDLRWGDIDFHDRTMRIHRLKNGLPANHPLEGDELRSLRKLQRLYPNSPWVFASELKGPLTEGLVWKIVKRAGQRAGFEFATHPHQLRHACGFYLASRNTPMATIKAYLGHKDLRQTVHYCQLAPNQFDGLWR